MDGTETVVAESSAAAVAPKIMFDGWDDEGTPIVTKKAESAKKDAPVVADAAAADGKKKTDTEDAADSAAKPTQGKDRSSEGRIKELLAKAKRLETELEEARKPKETKADSSTARPAAEKPATPPPTRPKPTQADKGTDGKPKYATYEDFNEDLVDWKVEQREAQRDREQKVARDLEDTGKRIAEARGRYADFDAVTKPLIQDLNKPDVSREVFAVLGASPVLADLLYTIGGTEASKADFLDACRTNPGKALRVALLMEQDIVKELEKGKAAVKKPAAGEADVTPATNKPRAPKPPAEVGGRGAPEEDPRISAAKANDSRSFFAEERRRALASRR